LLDLLRRLVELERERLALFFAILKLAWPFILRALDFLTAAGLSLFVSMVIDECSEDTIR
jgi:hypothetical protein